MGVCGRSISRLIGTVCFVVLIAPRALAQEGEEPPVANATTPHTLTGNPQIDYKYDPNLPHELHGYDLSYYPFYHRVPPPGQFNFTCVGRHDGFYASVPHHCQVYHNCLFEIRYDFLCANFTAFDQKNFICHYASEVDCPNSEKYYFRNDELYETTTTTTQAPQIIYIERDPRPPARPLTPLSSKRKFNRRPQPKRRPTPAPAHEEEYYYDDVAAPPVAPPPQRRKQKPRVPEYTYADDYAYTDYDYNYDYYDDYYYDDHSTTTTTTVKPRRPFRNRGRPGQGGRFGRPGNGGVFNARNRPRSRINPPIPNNSGRVSRIQQGRAPNQDLPESNQQNRKVAGPGRRRKKPAIRTTTTRTQPSDDYYDYDYDVVVPAEPESTKTTTSTTAPIRDEPIIQNSQLPKRIRRPSLNRRKPAEPLTPSVNEVSSTTESELDVNPPRRTSLITTRRRTRPVKKEEERIVSPELETIPEPVIPSSSSEGSRRTRPNRIGNRRRDSTVAPIENSEKVEEELIVNEVLRRKPLTPRPSTGLQRGSVKFPEIIVEEPPLAPGISFDTLESGSSTTPRRPALRRRVGQAEPVIRDRRPLRRSRPRLESVDY